MGVTRQFGVSTEVATLGLTLFVAGYGLGPMLWSPMCVRAVLEAKTGY